MTSELSIEVCFPGGKYHSTPWDRQVNEGVVEWPPSPWRLMRALISTWHAKATDVVTQEQLEDLINILTTVAPQWMLPDVIQGHTRHYMPNWNSTTKIFDNFLRVSPGQSAIAYWPGLVLNETQCEVLDLLLYNINYLGRSESWAEMRRIAKPDNFKPNAGPVGSVESYAQQQIVRYLMPMKPEQLNTWCSDFVAKKLQRELHVAREKDISKGKDPEKTKLTKKAVANIEESVAISPYGVLICETDKLKKEGWSQPPGSRWVEYIIPEIKSWTPPKVRLMNDKKNIPTVARYVVASNVPPRITTAIYQTDKLHKSLVSYSDGDPIFTGFKRCGTRLEGHQHAYLFAEANDGQTDRITHLNVWVPGGITEDSQRSALDRVQRLWGKDGHDLQLVLIGVGRPEDFAGTNIAAGHCPLMVESTHWRSLTPFINTRHPKRRKNGEPKLDERGWIIDGPRHNLHKLLREQGYPNVISIEQKSSTSIGGRNLRWIEFETRRKNGRGMRGPSSGIGFEIIFAVPVRGPIIVGYGAHFGLGVFTPG